MTTTFTQGQSYSGFTLKRHAFIQEIQADTYLFEHELLGCPVLAIKNSDNNKTFSAAFNTIPTDSTGVAHILEHSVLMGSEKYPIKDVFGEVNKGGLLTFLNAMTGSDITYYPFATRNLKEYYNIMDVYCDVVFNPLLDKSTFDQEGWHYHKESAESPLQYQGVVYNEMKGAFSDPIRLIFHHIFGGLLPDSTYAHESGGDPKNIPDLSYEEFCQFHKRHYHPSNGVFFFYGDAPLEDELSYLQNNFLNKFKQREERCEVSDGSPTTQPIDIHDTYNVESDNTSEKTFLAIGTRVSTVTERKENIAFQIIAQILFNSDGSPLKNKIVSSGLCKDFGGFYLSSSCQDTIMVSYLVGSESQHKEAFLDLYYQSLKEMVEKGIDKDLILSELNKAEFSVREDSSKAQRGLDLIGKAMTAFKYGTDPFNQLEIETLFNEIRQQAMAGNYFEQLIADFLLDNPSSVTVTLVPDTQKLKRNLAEEQSRLDDYQQQLKPQQVTELIDNTQKLMQAQMEPNSPEKLNLLPRLSIPDLNTNIDFHSADICKMFDQEVLVNQLPTNGISYLDIGFDISGVEQNNLSLVDLFGTILSEIGTKRLSYMAFAKEIATCTGSFSHSISTYTQKGATDKIKPVLWFHIKCLPEYLEQATKLASEVFSQFSFADENRIEEIVGREFAWADHSVQSEGYSMAATRASSHLSLSGQYGEVLNGATSYFKAKDLANNFTAQKENFIIQLKEIANTVLNRNNILFSITAEERELNEFSKLGGSLVQAIPGHDCPKAPFTSQQLPQHEAFLTSAEVVFGVQSGNLLPDGEGYNGHFEVLKTYLSRDYLWNSVRQMGGAYGCFIQFSQLTGNIAIVSYRDPQVKKTYDAYAAIPEVIDTLSLTPEVLEQLIVGTYGNFDPHQSSAAKGATAKNEYFTGVTTEEKKQRLAEITSTKVEDLKAFADPFAKMLQNSHRVIIGNRKKIEADKELFSVLTEL